MIVYSLEDVRIELIKMGISPNPKMAVNNIGMYQFGLCFHIASILKNKYIDLAKQLVKTSNMNVYYDQFSEEVNIDL